MKILHISTYDNGGAGIAAMRLHLGLLNEGVESKFLCLYKTSQFPEVYQFNEKRKLNIFERVIHKFFYPLLNEIKNNRKLSSFNNNYEIFTFPETDINLLNNSLVKDADIINLHWVGNYLDYSTFFRGINKPLVWTLHDKNPTLGGFHLFTDKLKNKGMEILENEIENKKTKYINEVKSLTIVSPSKFLMEFSQKSQSMKKFKHFTIPNSVDCKIFKYRCDINSEEYFGFPKNKKVVTFLNVNVFHKGNDLIFDIIDNVKFSNLHFVGIGIRKDISSRSNLTQIASIQDENQLALVYNQSALFLLPSREDNLPNMMVEALACGTPVLGTNIGGIPDAIEHGKNGLIASSLTAISISSLLTDFDKGVYNFNKEEISKNAAQKFNIPVQAKEYNKLYISLLAENTI